MPRELFAIERMHLKPLPTWIDYVHRPLEAYGVTPGTCGVVRRPDRVLAAQLHQRGVSLEAIENAFVLAAARPESDLSNGIFTRGVLVDIPRLKGLPYLDTGVVITPEDLDAWEKQNGVRAESGDVLLIRTGRWARRADKGAWDIGANSAGLSARCARWLKSRNIAMLGGDAASDALPSRIPGVSFPIHQLLLVAMGTPMLDQCQLEDLAKACLERNRWTFLFTVAPLRVKGGTGSPVNPIATF